MDNGPQPRIDLNSATEDELVSRLGLPPRIAKRIITMRPFDTTADLNKLWGLDRETEACLAALLPPAPAVPAAESPLRLTPLPSKPVYPSRPPFKPFTLLTGLGLLLILAIGSYFRFTGLNWDQNTHQHPDERFITMTADDIKPVETLSEYFDTENSTLNPLDFGSYTYGMLPLFITRYIAGWTGMATYDKVVLLGRALSGLFDLTSIFILFLVGTRYYNRRAGLLAAALAAAAVLPIQLSHYFAVDAFSTVFVVSAFWFTVQAIPLLEPGGRIRPGYHVQFGLFGLMIGLAMACKINTAPLFGIIGLAGIAHLISVWRDPVDRKRELGALIQGWIVAGLMTAVAFRVAQPYAFNGPGFFGVTLNERWLDVIKEVTNQVAGNSEWPPNHHWTDRSTWYALANIVEWGMGVPLGAAACLGWVYAAWRAFKGDWRRHLLPVAWVGAYFLWQNVQFWRYMRYFIPIYPILILLAAWALIDLYDRTAENRAALWRVVRDRARVNRFDRAVLPGALSLLAIAVIVTGTYAWAFAFTRIYNRPHTRVAASRWMLANMNAPLDVTLTSAGGSTMVPGEINVNETLSKGRLFASSFTPKEDSVVTALSAEHISLVGTTLRVRICKESNGNGQVAAGTLILKAGDQSGAQTIDLDDVTLTAGKTYYLLYTFRNSGQVSASDILLTTDNPDDPGIALNLAFNKKGGTSETGTVEFTPASEIRVKSLSINQFQQTFQATPTALQVSISTSEDEAGILTSVTWTGDFASPVETRFSDLVIDPVNLQAGQKYYILYKVLTGGPLKLSGDQFALETSWDDSLPLSIDGYSPLSDIFDPLNFEMYETDTDQKREKMLEILDQVEYLVIPSNRAYDSMPRLPQRYPLSTLYYQTLFDCSGCTGDALEAAGYDLEAGFHSPLGFDLVATFDSDSNLGPLSFNDQYADESFTVYDHPKVLIFKKSADYSSENVRDILETVDLSRVFYQSPKNFSRMPTGMALPQDRLEAQKAGGTWSKMFDAGSFLNTHQALGAAAWYLLLLLLGWVTFPLLFTAFGALPDRGYPLARFIGLLGVAWLSWMLASLKALPFTQAQIAGCLLAFALLNGWLGWRRWDEIKAFVAQKRGYLLGVELLFLTLFLADLAVRVADPDLWNPWLGGEKPMEFAFFNAILKAVYFPPEHPWFAGNYINYYYYGYVVAAIPTKLLGILPSIAFNLIIPTWFALVGVGIFSTVSNLVAGTRKSAAAEAAPSGSVPLMAGQSENGQINKRRGRSPVGVGAAAGIAAVVLMLCLGNLYQARQLYNVLPEVSLPGVELTTFIDKAGAAVTGGLEVLFKEAELPGDRSQWFFAASRPILHDGEDTPIAEFPLFTFLYADMHPHLLAMPAIFAALTWMVCVLLGAGFPRKWEERAALLLVGALAFGFTRPAHTWDFPSLVGLSAAAIFAGNWRAKPGWSKDLIVRTVLEFTALAAFAYLFYAPFSQWFGTEYTSFEIWKGARTPLVDYLTVHGLFLFILVTYLWIESYPWLRRRWTDRRSRLKGLALVIPGWKAITAAAFAIAAGILLWKSDYQTLVFGVPLLAWFIVLLLRKDQPVEKQFILGLGAAGVGVTLLVEVIVLKGDVGRSNMVFRYTLQAWAFFSAACAVALVEIFHALRAGNAHYGQLWKVVLAGFVLAAAAYPLTAISKRVSDRWPNITNPPHTLNGMDYMLGDGKGGETAYYDDGGAQLDLSLDYAGIRYMQDSVEGSPVIVEGLSSEYKWGNRYSIYTGLPAVMGWSWHVRQHNSLLDGAVFDTRTDDVNNFYNLPDLDSARSFLERYDVAYVIVGQMEREKYAAEGLAKFAEMVDAGDLKVVFSAGGESGLVIYRVVK